MKQTRGTQSHFHLPQEKVLYVGYNDVIILVPGFQDVPLCQADLAQVVMTVGAKVWLTSRALKSRHLQRIFIMPKACSMMVRALEPPLQWLSIQSDDG
ncbi:hypothetical protein ABVT39_019462 [Epinephelus coioides]